MGEPMTDERLAEIRGWYTPDASENDIQDDIYGRELLAELDRLKAERDALRCREEHFAKVLGVCDGGQYRADWDARIQTVVAERDALRLQLQSVLHPPVLERPDGPGWWRYGSRWALGENVMWVTERMLAPGSKWWGITSTETQWQRITLPTPGQGDGETGKDGG